MRLWSIHPKYLDTKGLLACWREALLAKKVLEGKTKGYKNHPQLIRFRKQKKPISCINNFLLQLHKESCKRGYCFNINKIGRIEKIQRIYVTNKQLEYEFNHLKRKLRKRDKGKYKELLKVKKILPNPIFKVKKGGIESWEKIRG